jgi:hypothetical protein
MLLQHFMFKWVRFPKRQNTLEATASLFCLNLGVVVPGLKGIVQEHNRAEGVPQITGPYRILDLGFMCIRQAEKIADRLFRDLASHHRK